MKNLLTFLFLLLALCARGAAPSFQSFNTDQFGVNGTTMISIKSGATVTNIIFIGSINSTNFANVSNQLWTLANQIGTDGTNNSISVSNGAIAAAGTAAASANASMSNSLITIINNASNSLRFPATNVAVQTLTNTGVFVGTNGSAGQVAYGPLGGTNGIFFDGSNSVQFASRGTNAGGFSNGTFYVQGAQTNKGTLNVGVSIGVVGSTLDANGIYSVGDFRAGSAGLIYWLSRSIMASPYDGGIILQDQNQTDSKSLFFGGSRATNAMLRIGNGLQPSGFWTTGTTNAGGADWKAANLVANTNVFAGGYFLGTNGIGSTRSNLVAPTAITIGASPVLWTNPLPVSVVFYVDAVSVTGTVSQNGGQIFSTIGQNTMVLQPNEYITLTFTLGTPTGKWKPL